MENVQLYFLHKRYFNNIMYGVKEIQQRVTGLYIFQDLVFIELLKSELQAFEYALSTTTGLSKEERDEEVENLSGRIRHEMVSALKGDSVVDESLPPARWSSVISRNFD